jgi:P27 family predicted phage terminase small subunit
VPVCPSELGLLAKREWKRIAEQLSRLGLLTTIDRAALALYCDAYGRWLEAVASLQKYGTVIKSPSGFPVQSPYVAIANKAGEQVRLLLAEFGMSPASRTRVQVELPPEEDDLGEFLRRRPERSAN